MIRRLLALDRRLVAFLHDLAMAAISFPLSLHLRLGPDQFDYADDALRIGLPIFVAVAAVVFLALGLYRGVWRYASMNDLMAILRAVALTILIFLPIMFLVSRLDGMPRSVLPINAFVLVCLLGAPRFLYRTVKDGGFAHLLERADPLRVPVLLVGAGDAAELFIRAITRNRTAPFTVVGILDPGAGPAGRRIHGVPVLGALDAAPALIKTLRRKGVKPQRLIIADETIAPERLRRLLEVGETHGLSLARLPRLTELQTGDGAVPGQVRPIAIEDLLGRPRTVLDRDPMRRLIAGRRVLVTGAGGSIGSELARQAAAFGPARLVLLDHSEFLLYEIERSLRGAFPELAMQALLADIRDRSRLEQVVAQERPELVFHAAALKHVPMAELNPAEAVLTNVIGTRNLAESCRGAGIHAMVLISTDKAVNPAGVLGATKRLAETYCQALDADGRGRRGTRYVTVRFGNVLGSAGSVVPLFQEQLLRGGPLTVTHPDTTRFFMTAREAVELVLQASAIGSESDAPADGALFVLDMGEPVRILDLARQMIRLSGQRPEVDVGILFTGLRPGEKLHERLLHPRETLMPTAIPGLLLAQPRAAPDWPLLRNGIEELAEAAHSGRAEQVLRVLRRMVPEYDAPDAAAARAAASQ